MDYFNKNMECIEQHKNYLFKAMMDVDISATSNHLEKIGTVDTRNGERAIVIQSKSDTYRLNSLYNPSEEAKKWVDQYEIKNLDTVISMFGLGNGVLVRALMDKLKKSDRLLVYEPSADIFYYVLHQFDLTDILSCNNISISIEKINEFEFHNLLQTSLSLNNIHNQMRLTYPQYDKVFPESAILFWKELKDIQIHTTININTQRYFGKRLIENILNNVKFLKNACSIIDLKNAINNEIPAIVVAAGPSIDNQVEALKKAKGKVIIFAVDRILDYLLNRGVEPDFIVTIDPEKAVKYFTNRNDVMIPLLCFIEANSAILELHQGKKVICNCSDYMEYIYKENKHIPPTLNSSASVATFAFTACVNLGFKTIILVGQDLAYDGNVTHAGGVEEKVTSSVKVMVEGINGEKVRSRYDWNEFLAWYQDMIIIYPEIKVIDAKDRGAKIKGTTVMTLQEALDLYTNKTVEFHFDSDSAIQTFNEEEWQSIGKFLQKSINTLDKIKSKANDAKKACEVLVKESKKNVSSNIIDEKLKKLEKINSYIMKQPVYCLLDKYVKAEATQQLSRIYQFEDNQMNDSINTYERAKSIFEVIISASEYTKPLLEKAMKSNF